MPPSNSSTSSSSSSSSGNDSGTNSSTVVVEAVLILLLQLWQQKYQWLRERVIARLLRAMTRYKNDTNTEQHTARSTCTRWEIGVSGLQSIDR